MSNKNRDFVMLTTNQAINLIMLNDSAKANNILKVLYDNQPDDPQFDYVEKKFIQSFIGKNKNDLVDLIYNPDKYKR